jgi:hypothetical protein
MFILILIIFILLACFAFVIAFGAPYLPTLKRQRQSALELLNLNPGQLLFEPGCGDGRMLLAAAKKGIKGIGYELNPILFVIAKIITWRYRNQVKIKHGNYWQAEWPKADGIYVFMLQKFMAKLNKKIVHCNYKNIKVLSYAFTIPGKEPVKEKDGLFLYKF